MKKVISRTVRSGSQTLPIYRRGLLAAAIALFGLAGLALFIDLPVAQWLKQERSHIPGELMRLINFSEVFAHGLGVAVLLLVALVLDPLLMLPSLRWPAMRWPSCQPSTCQQNLLRMIGSAYTGGLIVDCIKLLVLRVRPRAIDLALQSSVFSTFGTAALATVTGDHSRANLQSFPSGHAAVAAGLAAALGWKYPRGIPLFWGLAMCAAVQRIVTSAHYPSDVAFGAAIGLCGAAVFLGGKSPAIAEESQSARVLRRKNTPRREH